MKKVMNEIRELLQDAVNASSYPVYASLRHPLAFIFVLQQLFYFIVGFRCQKPLVHYAKTAVLKW